MSEQTKAIELANELESDPITNRLGFALVAAEELRRLSAANAELLEALQRLVDNVDGGEFISITRITEARAAIAKHGIGEAK